MHRNCLRVFCRVDCRFCRFHDAFVLQSGDFHDFTAKLAGKFCGINLIAVLFYDVHHVDCDNNRDSKLGELRCQIKVSFEVRTVDDV